MGKIFVPMSVPIAPSQANFPALVHSFTAADIAANGLSITDPLGGVVVSTGSGFVKSGNGFYAVGGSLTWAQNKAFTSPGSNAIVLLATGSMPLSAIFNYGDTSAGVTGIILAQNAAGAAQKDATDYSTGVVTTATAPLLAQAMKVDIPNDACKSFALGTGNTSVVSEAATITGSIAGPWGTPSLPASGSNVFLINSSYSVSGIFVLHFTAAPTDAEMETAVAWMAGNPGQLYPGFAGRT